MIYCLKKTSLFYPLFLSIILIASNLAFAQNQTPSVLSESHTTKSEIRLSYLEKSKSIKIKNDSELQGRMVIEASIKSKTKLFYLNFKNKEVFEIKDVGESPKNPKFSPNGNELIFDSLESNKRNVYSLKFSDLNLVKISQNGATQAIFSENGKDIYYINEPEKDLFEILKFNSSEQKEISIFKDSNSIAKVVPSPRLSELIFETNKLWPGSDIAIFDFKTRKSEVITTGQKDFSPLSWNFKGSAFFFTYKSDNGLELWMKSKGNSAPKEVINDIKNISNFYVNDKLRFILYSIDKSKKSELYIKSSSRDEKNKLKTNLLLESNLKINSIDYTDMPSIDAILSASMNNN